MMSRTKNSLMNIVIAVINQPLSLLISFLARIFFVRYLSAEYLGINGLFTNIISILSLAELGIGSAINYSLYKPLSEKNVDTIKSLMYFYKKAYRLIALIVFLTGLVIMIFIPNFVEVEHISNLRFIFFLFVLNSSLSYTLSYKRSLIIADQHRYIATLYRYVFYILLNIAQIFILYFTRNYVLFLCLTILCTLGENICISIKANRMYPYLKDKSISKLSKEGREEISKNTFAMLCHKLGGTVVNSTDNILMSKIVNIIEVGINSNYILITNALIIIVNQIYTATIASIGNLGVEESKEKVKQVFDQVFFLGFIITCFCVIELLVLFNPFITIWLGENMLFSMNIVIVICANFYIYLIRKPVLTFRDALGLFWYDRYKPLIEAIINLLISIILGFKFGTIGILLGTIISSLLTCVWIEPYVLFKYGLNGTLSEYLRKLSLYTVFTLLCAMVVYPVCILLPINFVFLIVRFIFVCIVFFILLVLFFKKTREYKDTYRLVKNVLSILKNKLIRR